MKEEWFEKLSATEKWDIVKFHTDFMYSAIHTRMSMLPMISGLSAALLVIVTFNGLLQLDWIVMLSFYLLLLLIPISLFLHNYDLKGLEKGQKEQIEKLVDGKVPVQKSKIKQLEIKIMGEITDHFPDIAILTITIIISIVILKIIFR